MRIWLMRIASWVPKAKNTHSEYVILVVFHCNNGYTNAPQYYVIRTLSVLFVTKNQTVFTFKVGLYIRNNKIFPPTCLGLPPPFQGQRPKDV